jgi:hypothetical protein
MLDAWSIIDSAHRCRDLIDQLPGLGNSVWKRLLRERTDEAADLRDRAQHQLGEVDGLIANGGQLWGYLSWAEIRDRQYTGQWLMMAGGSVFKGDRFLYIGPTDLPFPVPPGRVRLNAFGRQVYLGRIVSALIDASRELTAEIQDARVRPQGEPATERRGSDVIYAGFLEVVVAVPPAAGPRPED